MNKKFKLNDILEAVSLPDDPFEDIQLVEVSNWDQYENSDHQSREIIFHYAPDDSYYRYDQGRSGSPYTEWAYDDDGVELVECQTVKKVEKMVHYWQAI